LFLNIWTPAADDGRRPVMVWIHGGSFTMGAGSQTSFAGHNLALNHGLVIVTLNYRLGFLGFLNLNEVTGGKIPATGNEGLLDQIAALAWIRENIALFGGDPGNITLFGESAGAACIECLLCMPQAAGLFHKAILQSSIGNSIRTLDEAVALSELFLNQSGCRKNVEDLRNLSAERILELQRAISCTRSVRGTLVAPVIDKKYLTARPLDLLQEGSTSDIPLIIGTNREEYRLFVMLNPEMKNMDEAGLWKRCSGIVGEKCANRLIESYRDLLQADRPGTSACDVYTAIQTDLIFRLHCVRLLKACCAGGHIVHNYSFNWSPDGFGSCHAMEIGFVFGTYRDEFGGSGSQAAAVSKHIQEAWSNFARTGKPFCSALTEWPPFCPADCSALIDSECRIQANACDKENKIWEEFKW